MRSILNQRADGMAKAQRRKAARYQATSLPAFNFGEVLDISTTGMKVRKSGKPIVVVGGTETFIIVAGSGPVRLVGKIIWVRRPWPFAQYHVFGVRFLNTDESLRERLLHIGQYGFDNGPPPEPIEDAAKRRILASVEVENLYPILGVTPDSNSAEISKAYRTLVRRWHPDVCKDPEAPEVMIKISKAYKILRDPELRSRYDQMLRGAKAAFQADRPTADNRSAA